MSHFLYHKSKFDESKHISFESPFASQSMI